MLKSSRLLTNVQQFGMQTAMEGHRASAACHRYISVCLVSEIVILIRSYNVKQRAHREVRESEHTQGLQTSSGRFLAADRNEVKRRIATGCVR